MFVRIRGKGACPENSQAAVMHIRGFRHTHNAPPTNSFYPVYSTGRTATTVVATASSSSTAENVESKHTHGLQMQRRPFRYALFPVGIHSTMLPTAQAAFMKAADDSGAASASPTSTSENGSPATAASVITGPGSVAATLDAALAQMVWKETWNLYDILYDEVPLLPWSESEANAGLVAAVEEQLQALCTVEAPTRSEGHDRIAQKKAPILSLPTLKSMEEKVGAFERAVTRTGARQAVVCAHYYASAALPDNSFSNIDCTSAASTDNTAAAAGSVVVFDLSDLPSAQAGGKAMLNLAWLSAFASMQPDSPLLRCSAVVVRLPYAAVPSYAQASYCASETVTDATSITMADAYVDMVDFMGEHMSAIRQAMLREVIASAPTASGAAGAVPPLLVVGREARDLRAVLQTLLPHDASTASKATPVVTVYYGDHLSNDAGIAAAYTDVIITEEKGLELKVSLKALQVPLRALLDGGEEEWDVYTLRERQRLNFCPCCGDCDAEGAEGEKVAGLDGDHGHHHHGHHLH